tara:strand:- start:504 stop:620 length:117 start_codon:yes stop_codon:yes gene_type:complete
MEFAARGIVVTSPEPMPEVFEFAVRRIVDVEKPLRTLL